jgi:uncharacterized membrane protein (UPF0127 family)
MTKPLHAFLILFALGLSACATAAAPESRAMPLDSFPKSTLEIATPDARLHKFNIWIAADAAHREQGLMYVKSLAANAGMLFIYPSANRLAMWMKNTFIPLDILFIRADGRVSSIEANTKPLTLDNIESKEDVIAVLELKGGTAASLNIRKGAIVIHKIFGNTGQ